MRNYSKILRNIKHIFAIIVISLSMLFGSVMLFSGDFNSSINGFFLYRTGSGTWQDYFHRHRLAPSKDIVIIKIDEKSLNAIQAGSQSELRMLTIPKSTYANLVSKLSDAGVKGIAFDIVFQNKDTTEGELIQVLKAKKNTVIGAAVSTDNTCTSDESDGSVTCIGYPRMSYAGIPWGLFNVGMVSDQHNNTIQSPYVRLTRADISKANAGKWKYNLGLSTDIYTLPVALMALENDAVTRRKEFRSPSILNPYVGGPESYTSYSLIDVLNTEKSETLREMFSDKYVFVGEYGTLIHDKFTSPVTDTQMAGVEGHAQFFDALMQDKLLSPFAYNFLVIVILSIITVLIYYFVPKVLSPIIAIVIMGIILYISRWAYDAGRVVIDMFPLFLAGGVLTFPAVFIYRFFVVDREKRHIENAFGHYIDPRVVSMIDDETLEVTLGGERREVTLFFSDIAGFTSISEKVGTQELFYIMSSYLSKMTDILIQEGGTLDKYIGDAVMGFFGAPVATPDHAVRACRTALLMQAALPSLNLELASRGLDPISFRVGIATGEAMIGNIGSKNHFNYTALGDTVNLASRLEGTGKEYDVHIIISESTRAQIGDMFVLRELDTIAVKGKTEGIRIYEVGGLKSESTGQNTYAAYERALALYRAGNYLVAGQLWESQMATDPPSRVMAMRCVEILRGNLIVENGVYRMTHK